MYVATICNYIENAVSIKSFNIKIFPASQINRASREYITFIVGGTNGLGVVPIGEVVKEIYVGNSSNCKQMTDPKK